MGKLNSPLRVRKLIRLTDNFSIHEFACPCCNVYALDLTLVKLLQRVRNAMSAPVIIHHERGGAFRCPQLMAKMVTAGKTDWSSQHARDRAADFHVLGHNSPDDRETISGLLLAYGATGVGTYPWGLHVDTRPLPPGGMPVVWEERQSNGNTHEGAGS